MIVLKILAAAIGIIIFSFLTYSFVMLFTMPEKSRTFSYHSGPMPKFLIAIFIFGFAYCDLMFFKYLLNTLGIAF